MLEAADTASILHQIRQILLRLAPRQGRTRIAGECILANRYELERVSPFSLGRPSLCLVAQGVKTVESAGVPLVCGEGEFVTCCSVRPRASRMKPAGWGRPYLSVAVELDRLETASLLDRLHGMPECSGSAGPAGGPAPAAPAGAGLRLAPGTAAAPASEKLLLAFLRLLEIAESSDAVHVLAPRHIEAMARTALEGPLGLALKGRCAVGLHSFEIADAISWMRSNCSSSLDVGALARHVGMGVSTFHRHFKEETTLSPLQFHKVLRLNAARRRMLQEGQSSGEAAAAAGYKNPSQFCRDYARMFGTPPHRDLVLAGVWRRPQPQSGNGR